MLFERISDPAKSSHHLKNEEMVASSLMAVSYPDGNAGVISNDAVASKFNKECMDELKEEHVNEYLCVLPFESISELSIKSAPAEVSSMSCGSDQAKKWEIGSECLAPYIDGNYYAARIESFGPADLCAVFFFSFGHHSYLPIQALFSMPS